MRKDQTPVFSWRDTEDRQISFCSRDYNGKGASQGLCRGILVFSGQQNVTGEGMGLGSIALRKGGYTYFPTRNTTRACDDGIIEKVFPIDTWRKWACKGRSSRYLTRFIEFTADCYMAIPWVQPILCVQSPLIRALSLHPALEQIPPLAIAEFKYIVERRAVIVSCKVSSCTGDLPRIFILNELDGDTFCRAFLNGAPAPPPSGWRVCPDHAALSSREYDICFWITDISVGIGAHWKVLWGRERNDSLQWAGFEIMIDPDVGIRDITCSYSVRFGTCSGCGGD